MVNPTTTRIELAQRSGGGVEVTLMWLPEGDADKVLVSVYDAAGGAYFEIPAEAHLALDVYYHPFVYRDFSTVDYVESHLHSDAAQALLRRAS